MYSFLWRWTNPASEIKPPERNGETLIFNPHRIIQAIAFHLLDEGTVDVVNSESCAAAECALSQRFDQLSISADQWAAMENIQRIRWLLDQSHIVIMSAPSQTSPRSATLAVSG